MKKFLLPLFIICISFYVYAGTTGKIAGTVTDAKTGEPLIGVNVIVVGTSYGAATDFEGSYSILNVPPGTYSIRASGLGYGSQTVQNLQVNIDLTTRRDFGLSEEIVDIGKEVVITAERPLVQKDLTAKTAVVGGDDIKALPVTEIGAVLSLQAGFVAGSLRGGRSGEVATWIDGVPVTDVYNGNQVVEVNKSSVQELQLISGAFNAEYGQAMSGIVNIATREGGSKFNGGIGLYAGDYLSTNETLYPGLEFNPIHIRNIEGNLSGPIIGDNLTFFGNARYIYFNGWQQGFRRFNSNNIAYTDSVGVYHLSRDANGRGDSAIVPLNNSERKYGQLKLAWRILPLLKLTGNYIYDNSSNKMGGRNYFYNPDGPASNYDVSNTFIFQLSHTLNQSTFYTLGGSAFKKESKQYRFENPYDSRYVHPLLFQTPDNYSFLTGGTDMRHNTRSTTTYLLKLDVSSQYDAMNLFKAGVEVRQHDIRQDNIQLQPITSQTSINLAKDSPFIRTQILDVTSSSHDKYWHSPYEFSGYVQDKMEFKSIIVNIGIRYDYFEPDGKVLTDESDPSIFTPIKPGNRFFDNDGDGVQDAGEKDKTVADREKYWYKKATAKAQFSPRLGVSFPITERGIVHFSYGHFFQVPRFERLYENPYFKIGLGTGNQGTIGNADLKPEQTISAELGVQQQITDDIALDVTAYLRDIRGLTGTRSDEIIIFGGASKYSKYTNSDFGFVKGIVLTAEKRFNEGLSAKADYTFQIAKGTASDPGEARNAVTSGALPEVQLVPLGWDQRHTLNMTVTYHADRWLISSIGQFGSGQPYTPRKTEDISALLTNSQLKPTYFNVDLNTSYEFSFDVVRCILFARVFNVFDFRNETGVFDDTGRAGFTLDEAIARKTNPNERINTLEQWYTRPGNYSEPRRIEFGMNLEF